MLRVFFFFSVSKHPVLFFCYYHKQNLLLPRMVTHLLLFNNLSPSLPLTKSLQPQTNGLQKSFIRCTFIMKKLMPTTTAKYVFLCSLLLTEISHNIIAQNTLSLFSGASSSCSYSEHITFIEQASSLTTLHSKSRNASHSFASAISKEAK